MEEREVVDYDDIVFAPDPPRIINREDRYEVLKRQKWRCNFCSCKLKYSKDSNWEGEVAHIDHIHPYSERYTFVGGAENINDLNNLQALCPKCNLGKKNKIIN